MTEKNKRKLVHIFPQEEHHGEARIMGNREGLLELKYAIEEALKTGIGQCRLLPADDEGYPCYVMLNEEEVTSPFLKRMKLPYATLLDDYNDETIHPEKYGFYGITNSQDIPSAEKKIQEAKKDLEELKTRLNHRFPKLRFEIEE